MIGGEMALCGVKKWPRRNYVTRTESRPSSILGGGYKLWKKLSLLVALPSVALCMVNAYLGHQADHDKPRPEFVAYDHMRIRNKRFPWGDGTRSLIHNPHVNPLPTGYETDAGHH